MQGYSGLTGGYSISESKLVTLPDGETRMTRTWFADVAWASVLILHGLGEHSGRYEEVGEQLANAGVEVRSFDLPGFGASSGTRAYVESFDWFLDALEEELSHLAGQRYILGHSLGGLISYRYAVSFRPQPDGYILSAPALGANAPAWQRKAAPILAKLAPKLLLPNPIKGEQLSRNPEVGEQYFSDPLVHTSATAALGAELFATIKASQPVQPMNLPTLIIHGGSDTLVPPTASVPLGELDGVRRTLYPTLRHELFNEPEGPEVVADVISWMRENAS